MSPHPFQIKIASVSHSASTTLESKITFIFRYMCGFQQIPREELHNSPTTFVIINLLNIHKIMKKSPAYLCIY